MKHLYPTIRYLCQPSLYLTYGIVTTNTVHGSPIAKAGDVFLLYIHTKLRFVKLHYV